MSLDEALAGMSAGDETTFDSVLCVVAHPDDMEYGGSAAVSKWTDEGKEVAYHRIVSMAASGVLLIQYLLELGITGLASQFIKDLGIWHCREWRRTTGALGQLAALFG